MANKNLPSSAEICAAHLFCRREAPRPRGGPGGEEDAVDQNAQDLGTASHRPW